MFIQTEFMRPGGRIEHLTSPDGFAWTHRGTALAARPGTEEDGLYDPHPAVIDGRCYLVYSAMHPFTRVPQPDVHLACSTSGTWDGPWERLGKILDHHEIADHHNQRDHPAYEWGIEGPQLVPLPDGRVLLNATCFLPEGEHGQRQRVFLAIADGVTGPYRSLGLALAPTSHGENGHATLVPMNDTLVLCYQSRMAESERLWRYGLAVYDLALVCGLRARDAA